MKTPGHKRPSFQNAHWRFALTLICLLFARSGFAFPPAPHHVVFGLVRDELGNPLAGDNAQIILETATGVQIRGDVVPNLEPGVNYRLSIPMDAGVSSELYAPHALRPMVPFVIKVEVGGETYLPIEMDGDFASLGGAAKRTRIDLTLGQDSDGDGLPDAWERMLINLLGGNATLVDISPDGDPDKDGLKNGMEYIAGTYAHDPEEGFVLEITGFGAQGPWLDFLAIRARTYSILGSADLVTWTAVPFRLESESSSVVSRTSYYASDTRVLRVEAVPPAAAGFKFFKLQVH